MPVFFHFDHFQNIMKKTKVNPEDDITLGKFTPKPSPQDSYQGNFFDVVGRFYCILQMWNTNYFITVSRCRLQRLHIIQWWINFECS